MMTQPSEHPVHVLDMIKDSMLCLSWLRMTREKKLGTPQRVVIIENIKDVEQNFVEYQHLYVSGGNVVCVVVGPGTETTSGVELHLPSTLSQDGTAVLWVGDPQGVWWSPDGPGQSTTSPGTSGLEKLVDVLTIEDVFDEIVQRARGIPFATASPALYTVSKQVAREEVNASIWQVVPRLTATTESSAGLTFPIAVTDESAVDTAVDPVIRGSALDQARTSASRHAIEADQAVLQLGGRRGLVSARQAGSVRNLIEATGQEIESFTQLVREAAEQTISRARSGSRTDRDLADLGLGAPAEFDQAEVIGKLRDTVTTQLRAGWPLTEVAAALRDNATRIVPGGTRTASSRLASAFPEQLAAALHTPPRFPREVVPYYALPLVPLAAAVGAMLPGAFWLLGIAITVVWILAVTRVAQCRPNGRQEPALPAYTPVFVHAAAAACGVMVTRLAGPSLPVDVTAPMTAVFVIGLWSLLYFSWRRAVRLWRDEVGTSAAEQAVTDIEAVLHTVVDQEWRLAAQRLFWSDAMRTAAAALDDAATTLRGIAEAVDSPDLTAENSLLSGVIVDDLADLTLEALDQLWPALAAGQRLERAAAGVDKRMAELFGQYQIHLDTHGLQRRPPFGRQTANRELLITETLRNVPEIKAITQRTGREPMRQLCTAHDLMQLNRTANELRVVRFAPALAQSSVAESFPKAAADSSLEVCWTKSTLEAGIVRLVPLRNDVVRPYWPRNAEVAE